MQIKKIKKALAENLLAFISIEADHERTAFTFLGCGEITRLKLIIFQAWKKITSVLPVIENFKMAKSRVKS